MTLGFEMTMPRYAESGPQMLRFFPFGATRAFTQALAPLSERKCDVVFPGTWTNSFSSRYTLPAGWVPDTLPAQEALESPFGSFTLSCTAAPALDCQATMALKVARVSAKDYPKFREWLLKVDQAFSRKLVVRKLDQSAKQ